MAEATNNHFGTEWFGIKLLLIKIKSKWENPLKFSPLQLLFYEFFCAINALSTVQWVTHNAARLIKPSQTGLASIFLDQPLDNVAKSIFHLGGRVPKATVYKLKDKLYDHVYELFTAFTARFVSRHQGSHLSLP